MLEMIMSNIELIITTVTGIVTVASLLVAGTKTPAPDSVLGKIYKVLEFLSLTVGKAKETGKQITYKAGAFMYSVPVLTPLKENEMLSLFSSLFGFFTRVLPLIFAYKAGSDAARKAGLEDALDKVNERNKIETEISMLSSGDVIKRLRKRWRRDV